MGKHIWGYWDCDCGRKHIRGDKTDCPGCGRPRNENTKFYVDSNSIAYVEDTDKNNDPDWICGFCSSGNSSKLDFCARCGASKESSTGNYFDYHSDEKSGVDSEDSEVNYSCNSEQIFPDKEVNEVSGSKPLAALVSKIPIRTVRQVGIGAIVVAVLTAIVFFCIWLFTPIEHQMAIEGFEWSRNIEIEELRTFDESEWSLPSEARLQYTRNELHHYEDVFDHYETKSKQVPHERIVGYDEHTSYRDLGNGQFEEVVTQTPVYETYYETEYYESAVYRQEPRYATKYYYEIDRWVHGYDVPTFGFDKDPYWGTYTLGAKERKGKSSERYYITGCIDSKERKFSISFSDWKACEKGNTVSFTTYRFSSDILEIEFLHSNSIGSE